MSQSSSRRYRTCGCSADDDSCENMGFDVENEKCIDTEGKQNYESDLIVAHLLMERYIVFFLVGKCSVDLIVSNEP